MADFVSLTCTTREAPLQMIAPRRHRECRARPRRAGVAGLVVTTAPAENAGRKRAPRRRTPTTPSQASRSRARMQPQMPEPCRWDVKARRGPALRNNSTRRSPPPARDPHGRPARSQGVGLGATIGLPRAALKSSAVLDKARRQIRGIARFCSTECLMEHRSSPARLAARRRTRGSGHDCRVSPK